MSFYVLHNNNWRTEWISSNLSVFCFLYPYLQFSIDNDLGWWHMAKRKKMQLLWNPRKSWRCFFAASWYPTDLKCVKKKFRNASKNLLTCTLLAFRKILSYIPDQSDLRQQSINISNICSSPGPLQSALAASRRPRPGRARVRCVNH